MNKHPSSRARSLALLLAGVGATASVEAAAPEIRTNPRDDLKYVRIPPGAFVMGCSDGDTTCADNEKPAHPVRITKAFWIGQTEVTVGAYKRFSKATGQKLPDEPDFRGRVLNPGWSKDDLPMVDVTWGEARRYCEWTLGRLPTGAEWEYAARAGARGKLYGEVDEISWNADNSGKPLDAGKAAAALDASGKPKDLLDVLRDNGNGMHPVGQKKPNAFSLFDMLGNVLEWVSDWHGTTEMEQPVDDPQGPLTGTRKGSRGWSWITTPDRVKVTGRTSSTLDYRSHFLGIRCVQP